MALLMVLVLCGDCRVTVNLGGLGCHSPIYPSGIHSKHKSKVGRNGSKRQSSEHFVVARVVDPDDVLMLDALQQLHLYRAIGFLFGMLSAVQPCLTPARSGTTVRQVSNQMFNVS